MLRQICPENADEIKETENWEIHSLESLNIADDVDEGYATLKQIYINTDDLVSQNNDHVDEGFPSDDEDLNFVDQSCCALISGEQMPTFERYKLSGPALCRFDDTKEHMLSIMQRFGKMYPEHNIAIPARDTDHIFVMSCLTSPSDVTLEKFDGNNSIHYKLDNIHVSSRENISALATLLITDANKYDIVRAWVTKNETSNIGVFFVKQSEQGIQLCQIQQNIEETSPVYANNELGKAICCPLERALLQHLGQIYNALEKKIEALKGSPSSDMPSRKTTNSKQLQHEIMGIFYRSQVPKNEYPGRGVYTGCKTLSKEICRSLDEIEGIHSYGYRCDELCIFLKNGLKKEKLKFIEENVKAALKSNDISSYQINATNDELFTKIESGSCIAVKQYKCGTLGGLSWRKTSATERIPCAIISAHVANGSSDPDLYIVSNESPNIIGQILSESLHPKDHQTDKNLDIAAADIVSGMTDTHNVGMFKNSHGDLQKGQVCDFSDIGFLNNRRVYINGASTQGKGILSIPSLVKQGDGMELYMKIVDEDDSKKFSKKGDSGAIVCTDDTNGKFIHLIGVLIGSSTDTNVNSEQDMNDEQNVNDNGNVNGDENVNGDVNGFQQKTYTAFRLRDGLAQLGTRCECSFEFFDNTH